MAARSEGFGNVNRREMLSAALVSAAAAAVALETGGPAAAAEAKFTLRTSAQAEVQKFAWGSIRWLMNATIDPQAEMTLGIVQVEAHQSNPLHVHPNSAECLYMLSGTCQQRVGTRWFELKAGDTLRIPQGVVHQARSLGQPFCAIVVYNTGTRQMVPVDEGKTGDRSQ